MTGPSDEQELAADLRRASDSYEPDSERIADLLRSRMAASPAAPAAPAPRAAGAAPRRALSWVAAAASVAVAVLAADLLLGRWDGSAPDPGTPATALPVASSSAAFTTPPSSATRSSSASGGGSAPSVGTVVGDRSVTATVTPVASGSRRVLGSVGNRWVAAPGTPSGGPPHGTAAGWPVGPPQVMGSGASSDPGPFALSWSDATSGPGNSTVWLTAPHDVRGAPAGVRVPVRHGPGTVSVTFLVGTVGGAGRLALTLPDGTTTVDLPGCAAAACPAVVRITMSATGGGTLPAGDVTVDLTAVATNGRVGFAAAELGS